MDIWTQRETQFLVNLLVCLACGYVIGTERELRHKAAGISTNCFVIAGAMLFAFISQQADPNSPARIAAQIVSGVGFLGAGIILKSSNGFVRNLTTAASIWFSASIGMAVGFGWHSIAVMAMLFSVLVPRIPHISGRNPEKKDDPDAEPEPGSADEGQASSSRTGGRSKDRRPGARSGPSDESQTWTEPPSGD